MRGAVLLVLATGCNQILGVGSITLGDGGHGSADGTTVFKDTPNTACIMGSLISPCFPAVPTGMVTIDTALDTDNDPRCVSQRQASGLEVCLIGGGSLTVTGTVRATGSRPLVLVAVQDLEIDGTIDIQGTAGTPPAGANTGGCNAAPGAVSGSGGSGGGGGSLGTSGAIGGAGPAGGVGGGGGTSGTPNLVRGGCPGGAGSGPTPAGGGLAAGVVYFVGGNSIELSDTGSVLASGGGGAPGQQGSAGGGGGASGGMVGFDAPTVGLDGTVIANGGGGGGGASATAPGGPGAIGTGTSSGGGGGAAGCTSSGGGAGGVNMTAPANGTSSSGTMCGGGGGGGSVGIVWLNTTFGGQSGNIQPPTTGP